MSRAKHRLCGIPNALHQVIGGILRGHSGVDKSDQVGNRVITKQQVHLHAAVLIAMDGVQLRR